MQQVKRIEGRHCQVLPLNILCAPEGAATRAIARRVAVSEEGPPRVGRGDLIVLRLVRTHIRRAAREAATEEEEQPDGIEHHTQWTSEPPRTR